MLLDSTAALEVETVSTLAGLERLRGEWRALWAEDCRASAFQAPEWLIPWWRHLGGEGLRTLVVRREGRPLGVAPLFLFIDPADGTRQLTLLGNGVSDRLDVLARPEAADLVATAVLDHLAARHDWDRCDFRDLDGRSPLLRAGAPPGLRAEVEADEPCPVLRLPGRADGLDGAIPPGFLKKLRYARRRAEREGEVRVEAATEETAESALESLFRLHRARWRERGTEGVLGGDGRVERFHREVVAGFARGGLLRLYTLQLGGRIAAVLYGFHAHGRTSYYLGGFDPELRQLGPGNLVLLHAVEAAVREGAAEFDFLRGREPYKYAWGAEDRPHFRQRWARRRGAS